MKRVAFIGPSLAGAPPRGVELWPPARQGDVWRALAQGAEAIALIDGVFEAQPSVWHHELLDAIAEGVPVFGGASMGALRAAELHRLGMVGVGRIFGWYASGALVDDSDVALLHADGEHGWRALTVPLVNVRWSAERQLSRRRAQALTAEAGRIFYQERTLQAVLALLPRGFEVIDLKAEDARATLAALLAATPIPRRAREVPSHVRRARLAAVARGPGGDARERAAQGAAREGARPEAAARIEHGQRGGVAGGRQPPRSSRPEAAATRDMSDSGLRRILLATRARELGLVPGAKDLDAFRAQGLRDERLIEELALERQMLDNAALLVNDGPSVDEAIDFERKLQPLFGKVRT